MIVVLVSCVIFDKGAYDNAFISYIYETVLPTVYLYSEIIKLIRTLIEYKDFELCKIVNNIIIKSNKCHVSIINNCFCYTNYSVDKYSIGGKFEFGTPLHFLFPNVIHFFA